ncbi:MAG: hypothetical protein KAJ19_18145 [Gammaproteobacteria bacterium]|nr:hypothetical protein [Gammaproteobacteria bacterium]
MTTWKPGPPTHSLGLMDKETGDRGTIGSAWETEHGSFNIKLNPGVVLTYDMLKGNTMTLRLFKRDENPPKGEG